MRSKQSRLTQRISLTIAAMAVLVGILNFVNVFVLKSWGVIESFAEPGVWTMPLYAAIFWSSRYLPEKPVQGFQVGILILLSGPMVLTSYSSFFGMWFFLLGTVLFYKYGFLEKNVGWKLSLLTLYFVPWLVLAVLTHEGSTGKELRIVNDMLFLTSGLVFLYFIFEEDIRTLLASNRQKDLALEGQAVELARMEPLSVLGERVAHVTHSFKNNLSQLKGIATILETTQDAQQGADLLNEVADELNERIENILMVSRAGVDLEPETFDAARVLEGMKFVSLAEPSFAQHVWHETTLHGPALVRAIRWDFILMVENILKNAIEAIRARGVRGVVRIDLTAGLLTIANNGGAMELCQNCLGNCLECQRYGRPGGTTKAQGSGHGLAQVFAACRKNGWALRIRTENEWTTFQILLQTATTGQRELP